MLGAQAGLQLTDPLGRAIDGPGVGVLLRKQPIQLGFRRGQRGAELAGPGLVV